MSGEPALGRAVRLHLAQDVRARVTRAIRDGGFRPGEQLVESRIATEMGVSRAPVREAFRLMADAGLVEFIPGRGCFVPQPTTGTLLELVQLRAIVEGAAARLVAAQRDASVLANLRLVFEELEEAALRDDIDLVGERDWTFHQSLCEASGSALLAKTWFQLRDSISLFMSYKNPIYRDRVELIEHHRELLECLERAGPATADRVFRSHILSAGYGRVGEELPTEWVD